MSIGTIFLDVDGVLTHYMMQHYIEDTIPDRFDIDVSKLKMLADFVYAVDADVVLCSAWRGADQFIAGPHAFADYLFDKYMIDLPVIGYTECLGIGTKRQDEINQYIDRNRITNFVVLDDTIEEYTNCKQLIHVSNVDGLLLSDLIKAADVLNVEFMPNVMNKRWSSIFPKQAKEF